MKTYNTYQEAKIANPSCEIYVSICGNFAAQDDVSTIALSGIKEGWNKCNPADYCMSLESFLASGKRAFKGDIIADKDGKAMIVEAESIVNTPFETDCEVYVIKAKALESPAHEWVNGDECEIEMYGERESYVFGCLVHGDRSKAIVFTNNGHMTIPVCRLLKPETPEQKLDRERRDLINDTCEELFGDLPGQLRPDVIGTIEAMIDAGYRKEIKS